MIRPFQHQDMDALITIWLEASMHSHDFIDSTFWQSKAEDMRTVYLPAAETYIYGDNGVTKGFASLSGNTLAALFVSPAFQGTGIGTQLISKVKQVRDTLNLTVYTENKRSIEFYKKCGFSVVHERIDDHTGHSELEMVFNS